MYSGNGPELSEGLDVLFGAVAKVLVKAVPRITLMQFAHLAVAKDFGKNGRGRHRDAGFVSARGA